MKANPQRRSHIVNDVAGLTRQPSAFTLVELLVVIAVIAILATVAKQERVRLSERTRTGIAIARSRGKQIGRPRLTVKTAEVARLRAQGHSLRAIGRTLGVSEGSIRRMASATA